MNKHDPSKTPGDGPGKGAPGEPSADPGRHASARQDGPEDHDPTGLGLARAIAGSVGAQRRRRRHPHRTATEPQSSGARPDGRDPQLLSEAVDRLVESKGWTTDISVHTLLGRWALLVGPVNAAHSKPESYQEQTITVRTDSTAWATQFRMMAPQLVAMLSEQLGDGVVTTIKVLGPDAPSWKKGRMSVRDGRGPRDTYG